MRMLFRSLSVTVFTFILGVGSFAGLYFLFSVSNASAHTPVTQLEFSPQFDRKPTWQKPNAEITGDAAVYSHIYHLLGSERPLYRYTKRQGNSSPSVLHPKISVMEASSKQPVDAQLSINSPTGICTTVTDISLQECLALETFFNSTNGDKWTNKTNWLQTPNACTWFGVTCEGGRVVQLILINNQLSGTIPFNIGNLTRLQTLFLNTNQLSGAIPPEIGNLTQLEYLTLHQNHLTGVLPPTIGNLSRLIFLHLAENQLSGTIPKEIGQLTSLQTLHLYANQLSGVLPSEIWSLTQLEYLTLYQNELVGVLPPALGNLNRLITLNLASNQLSGIIPKEIGQLASLQHLSLSDNQLTGAIPSEIGSLTQLTDIGLDTNLLTGVLPPEIGNLDKLTFLSLAGNQLSGAIPDTIGNLVKLQQLYLHYNRLTGSIPASIGNLRNLEMLILGTNQLSGAIPPEVGNLQQLQVLHLWNNQLTGTIPKELSQLQNLQRLYLNSNQLTGTIPSELGQLINLKLLTIERNQLAGKLPATLGNLTNLEELYVGLNPTLVGPLPEELGNLNKLTKFKFDNTNLCEPRTAGFQAWLASLRQQDRLGSTNIQCAIRLSLLKNVSPGVIPLNDVVNGAMVKVKLTVFANDATTIMLTDTIPPGLSFVPGTAPAGVTYNPATRNLSYASSVLPNSPLLFTYQAVLNRNSQAGAVFNIITQLSGKDADPITGAAAVVIPNLTAIKTLYLIYVGADNELAEDGQRLLNNAERALSAQQGSPNNAVVVLLDGPEANDTRLYYVQADPLQDDNCPNYRNPTCNDRYEIGKNLFEGQRDDTSNKETLTDFIVNAIQAYPGAEQVVLSLVGHGSGWSPDAYPGLPTGWHDQPGSASQAGLLWDQSTGRTISTKALGEALSKAYEQTQKKLSLLYLDACSMAMAEIAYELAGEADYMLASQNIKWALFPYSALLSIPSGSSEEIGRQWFETEDRVQRSSGYPYTFSLIDLNPAKMTALKDQQQHLATLLRSQLAITSTRTLLTQAWRNTQCFDSNYDRLIDDDDTYCDLGSFMLQLGKQFSATQEVAMAAQGVLGTVKTIVLAETHKSGALLSNPEIVWDFVTKDGISGLSIYLPLDPVHDDGRRSYYTDFHLKWVRDTGWDRVLDDYHSSIQASSAELSTPCSSNNCRVSERPLPISERQGVFSLYLPIVLR